MRRITISIEETIAVQFDELIAQHGYQNRSEAFRDLLRSRLEGERIQKKETSYCVATVSYIYNHHERELASKLATLQHDHHEIYVSSMRVPLDHDNCVETLVLRGAFKSVSRFAKLIIAQNGVRHGEFNIIPVDIDKHAHAHPHTHSHSHVGHLHFHMQPKT